MSLPYPLDAICAVCKQRFEKHLGNGKGGPGWYCPDPALATKVADPETLFALVAPVKIPVLWTSDCGKYGVAYAHDLPLGIPVGYFYTTTPTTVHRGTDLESAIEYAKADVARGAVGFTFRMKRHPDHPKPGIHVCSFRFADIPGGAARVPAVTSPASTKKVIPDWPLTCLKCGRKDSAVLLFAGYDCKNGCYK